MCLVYSYTGLNSNNMVSCKVVVYYKGDYMPKEMQSPGLFLALMLEKHNLNPFKLSKDICLSQSAVRLITIGKTKITVPVAMRLAKYFNTSPEYWLDMQMKWDIAKASQDKALMKKVNAISRFSKSAAGGSVKGAVSKKAASAKKTPSAKKPVAAKNAVKAKKAVAARKPIATKKAVAARKAAVKKPVGKKPAGKRSAKK